MDLIQLTEDEKSILVSIIKRIDGKVIMPVLVHIINKIVMIKYVTLTTVEEKLLFDIMDRIPGIDADGDLYFVYFNGITNTGTIEYAGTTIGRF
jgi:hypothetical protein